MKVKYDKPKGYRIKKGTYKSIKAGRRFSIFMGLEVLNRDYDFYSDDLNKWVTTHKMCEAGGNGGTRNDNIHSLKSVIRHIKKHNELEKGTELRLTSRFRDYDIIIIK
jgi:hypothetical protein